MRNIKAETINKNPSQYFITQRLYFAKAFQQNNGGEIFKVTAEGTTFYVIKKKH